MTSPTGALLGKYRKSPIKSQKRLLIWIVLLLAVCLLGRVGGTSVTDNALGMILMIAGIGVGLVGLFLDLPHAFLREETLELYSDGFVLQTPQGKQPYTWDEVQEYTYIILRRKKMDAPISTQGDVVAGTLFSGSLVLAQGIFPAVEYRLILRTADQVVITLNNHFQDISTLANALNEAIHTTLVAKCLHQLTKAKQVKFGEFVVSKESLHYKNKSIAWKEVSGLAIESVEYGRYDGIVVKTYQTQGFLKGNTFAKEKFGNVPNAFALLELGNQLAKDPQFLREVH